MLCELSKYSDDFFTQFMVKMGKKVLLKQCFSGSIVCE